MLELDSAVGHGVPRHQGHQLTESQAHGVSLLRQIANQILPCCPIPMVLRTGITGIQMLDARALGAAGTLQSQSRT